MPAEVFVVNDASDQAEHSALVRILSNYADLQINLISLEENCGPSAARNAGWESATAEYIAFLDADDSWHPDKLKIQSGFLNSNPGLGILGARREYVGLHLREEVSPIGAPKINFVSPRAQIFKNHFSTSSVVVRRDSHYRFNSHLRYSEDNDLWCRILLCGGNGAVIDQVLTYYHKPLRSNQGASGRYFRMFVGQLKVFSGLRRDSLISLPDLILTRCSSVIRFARRMTLVLMDNLRSR